ncbi:GntR family transcriptional regulator [bacterium]|nr:MAG: GntR family transcriptional regulator [bacterium]
MKKVALAAQMIEKRIAHADHLVGGIPSERQLAEEMGLSRSTVRTAIQYLVEKGTLTRHENGRIKVAAPADGARHCSVCFIAPVGSSGDVDQWRESAQGVLRSVFQQDDVTMRSFAYAHLGDPTIQEALAGFDAAFFITPAERIPAWLVAKIKDSSCRVVVLDQDESDVGLPSVTLFPPAMESKLFDHLYRLGHRRIDCLNTQESGVVIQERIAAWRDYLQSHGLQGQLRSLEKRSPIESAYRVVRDALQEGQDIASALFCTTGPAAIGAIRALHEVGLKIGSDVSVCAVNSEGLGRYLMTSLTALEAPPRALYLRRVAEWMTSDDQWQGPLLIQPDDLLLFEGESTGVPLASRLISTPNATDHQTPLLAESY